MVSFLDPRAMYAAEDVDGITAEDFIQMLVLDGCFIMEHLVNVVLGQDEQSLHATPFGPPSSLWTSSSPTTSSHSLSSTT